MYVLGLTGGIATGKSNVSKTLRLCGAKLWDADKASREVVKPGQPGNLALRQIFGDTFFKPDGTLKRRELAQYVFGDVDKLRKLNSTLHPAIIFDLHEHLKHWRAEGVPLVVVDAALLFETGIDELCDEVWMTACGPDMQIDRLMSRDHLEYEQAVVRIEAQMVDEERRQRVQRVIDTSGPLEETQRFVRVLYEELMDELGVTL